MDRKIRKNKKSYTLYDMYNNYCREFGNEVPYVTFKSILEKFNDNIKESIINRSESFKMPFGLGYVCIIKYKPKQYNSKSLSMDYKASAEEGKRIYHLNETFPDRYRYQLQLVRKNKRELAQLIFNHKDYINIDDIQIYKM